MNSPKTRSASQKNTLKAVAAQLGVHRTTLENWRHEGCPGLPPGRVNLPAVREWADNQGKRVESINPERASIRRQLGEEQIRKLQLHNDAKEETLISREWLVERMGLALANLKPHRAKSEAEHPLLFNCPTPEATEECRKIIVGMWDGVFAALNDLHDEFKGTAKKGSNA